MRRNAASKVGAEEMEHVRIEGSVLLAFERAGLVKLDQLVGNAPRFHVCVDAAFAVWRFCATSARIWPTHVSFAVFVVSESPTTPVADKP